MKTKPLFLAAIFLATTFSAQALTYTWFGGSGIWENTNNWSPITVSGPTYQDSVVISSGTVHVSSGGNAGSLMVANATLDCNNAGVYVNNNATVAAGGVVILTGGNNLSLFSGGSFNVVNTLTLEGQINWHDGVLSAGTLLIATNGVISATSAYNHYFSAALYNDGQILWSADILTSGGLRLQNQAGGLLDFQTGTFIDTWGGATGPTVFINHGTLLKSAGTNALFMGITSFTNGASGSVTVRAGAMTISANNTDLAGTLTVSNNAALNLAAGTVVLEPGHLFTGPGYYGVAPFVNLTLYGDVSDANFQITNATIYGAITVSGTLNSYDGGFQNTMTVASNGVLNLTGCSSCGSVAASTQTASALTNAGTINWLSGDWTCEGGTFVNPSGALFRIECDNPVSNFGGKGNWLNAGTIRKTASTGTNIVSGAVLNNQGLLDVQTGGLNFQTTFTSSGTINVSAGAGFPMSYGTFYLNPGNTISGAGFCGVPLFQYCYIYGFIGGTNFQMNGQLYGSNTVTGTLNGSGATFNGVTAVAPGGVMNLSGGPGIGYACAITNAGTINWLAGTFSCQSSSTFVNQPGGLFNIQCNDVLQGGGTWFNYGTLRKSAGAGLNYVGLLALTNSGLLDMQSGGLEIACPFNLTGGQVNFGLASPSQYGRLVFDYNAPLAGTLSANLIGGYQPAPGTGFKVLAYASQTGAFGSVNLPALANNNSWSVITAPTLLTLKVFAPPPVLSITTGGGGFNIRWPTNADAGHSLKYATSLTPPVVWLDVTNSVQTVNGQNVVNFPLDGDARFFELQ